MPNCTHPNKAYGPVDWRGRVWICRDCGQEGHEPDDKYSKDYYRVLVGHIQAGTRKGEEEAK